MNVPRAKSEKNPPSQSIVRNIWTQDKSLANGREMAADPIYANHSTPALPYLIIWRKQPGR